MKQIDLNILKILDQMNVPCVGNPNNTVTLTVDQLLSLLQQTHDVAANLK